MQQTRSLLGPEGPSMAYDVRLATRITASVDRRLRMLALIKSQSLSHVLVSLLDQSLPPADELASLLGDSRHGTEPETEAAA
jgi:hypothetical protein